MSGPKVTLHADKKPAAQPAPADANVVTDSLGRKLTVKTLDILYESRLARIVGAEAAANATYMLGYVFPAVSVVAIDGEDVPLPQTQLEIDASITRLGREGLTAVMRHIEAQAKAGSEDGAVKN